jgi:predicted sulfurtransferase
LDKTKKYIHLDVRNKKEWQDTGTLNDAITISLPELNSKIKEVIDLMKMCDSHDLVVNCRSGIRARFASSILLKNGIIPIILNENI